MYNGFCMTQEKSPVTPVEQNSFNLLHQQWNSTSTKIRTFARNYGDTYRTINGTRVMYAYCEPERIDFWVINTEDNSIISLNQEQFEIEKDGVATKYVLSHRTTTPNGDCTITYGFNLNKGTKIHINGNGIESAAMNQDDVVKAKKLLDFILSKL